VLQADEFPVELRPIQPGDKVTGLSLGDQRFTPLKTFLQKQAKEYSNQLLAKSYGVFQNGKILGYITLVCGEIASEDDVGLADVGNAEYRYKHYPAVKIARLAMDRRYRGSGLGKNLVDFALGMAKRDISTIIGCRFVVVDAKRESVGRF
jgi:GNAT superfamily N-acetyltransferase